MSKDEFTLHFLQLLPSLSSRWDFLFYFTCEYYMSPLCLPMPEFHHHHHHHH